MVDEEEVNNVHCSSILMPSQRINIGGSLYRVWWGNLRERDEWGGPGVDGRIILKWIFRKWDVGVWTGLR
jgi:hypothetical protein